MIGNINALQQSSVKGSSVFSDIKHEIIKKGNMYILQRVFRGIAVGASEANPAYFTFLFELDAVDADFFVLYEIKYKVNKGQAIGTFYGQGDYVTGTLIPVNNRNENSGNTAKAIVSYRDDLTAPLAVGPEGQAYLAGSEGTGTTSVGGQSDTDFLPTEVNTSINRILQIEQAGGTGVFNLELRMVFAELYLN